MENKVVLESDLNGQTTLSENEPVVKKAKLAEITEMSEINQNSSNRKNNDDSDDEDYANIETEIPEPGFDYPIEYDASDMLEEVDSIVDGRLLSVTDRYLTPYYQIDIQKPGDDMCIYVHSNRICMITLAPSHIIFKENKKIVKCDYKVTEKCDRTKNKVSGKAKRGAQPLQSNSNLCRLTCDDGSIHTIKCCMIGKLVEVNLDLLDNPELLKKQPHHGGYIAVALPNLKHIENLQKNLLDKKQYEKAILKRNGVNLEDMDIQETQEKVGSEVVCIHIDPEIKIDDSQENKNEDTKVEEDIKNQITQAIKDTLIDNMDTT